jgi:hypothetical protein
MVTELHYIKNLTDFLIGELTMKIKETEAIHIGSFYKSKDEIINEISGKASELLEFLNYYGWCMDFICHNKSFEVFIDWQLDELNSPNNSKERKEFISQMLTKFGKIITE